MRNILLILLSVTVLISCEKDTEDPAPYYSIEGKWIWSQTSSSSDSNTMYIFEDGIRYTYYCVKDDCNAIFNSYEANDWNHLPATYPYTFENGILKIDLHHGNELVAPIIFECDGGKILVESQNPYYLYRLNYNCQ